MTFILFLPIALPDIKAMLQAMHLFLTKLTPCVDD